MFDKLPPRIDNIVGNPHTLDDPSTTKQDFLKTIYHINNDQTILTGTIIELRRMLPDGSAPKVSDCPAGTGKAVTLMDGGQNRVFCFSGKFVLNGATIDAKDLNDTQLAALYADFSGKGTGLERAKLTQIYPGLNSNINMGALPNPNGGGPAAACSDDADLDAVTNAGDNCPNTPNPNQQDVCQNLPKCDVNFDGKIDLTDINLILEARGTPAGIRDARDVDGDGLITANDARICALRCTNASCAVVP